MIATFRTVSIMNQTFLDYITIQGGYPVRWVNWRE